jgi:hypothetical protein
MLSKIKLRCSWLPDRDHSLGTWVLSNHLSSQDLSTRITVAHGIRDGYMVEDGWLPYRTNAFVPANDWRRLTRNEVFDHPEDDGGDAPGSFVALANISRPTIERLKILDGALTLRESDAMGEFAQLVEAELVGKFDRRGDAVVNGIARGKSGLETSTFDPKNSWRVGMHLDSWEAQPLQRRRFARNRISINFGSEPRQFLFMATPVDFLFERLQLSPNPDQYLVDQLRNATKSHIRKIYSLEVRSSEAYIAPTECLVHDARTRNMKNTDLSATIRMPLMPATQIHGDAGPRS